MRCLRVNKVSIFCLTYNHVEYIEDALRGFLGQKTDFDFNILIYDDASTDGTSEIVRKYQQKYPDKITAYISPENLYENPKRNAILNNLYKKYLDGEYIAWCEGDDYWIDYNKLQIQVAYLDNNKECAMVTHAYKLYDCNKKKFDLIRILNNDGYLTNRQIINKTDGYPTTGSLIMRREVFFFEDDFPKSDVTDVPLQLNAIRYGKVYYINKCMSVYRYMHQGSWWNLMSQDFEKMVIHKINFALFLKRYNEYTNNYFNKYINKLFKNYLYDVSEAPVSVDVFRNVYRNTRLKLEYDAKILYDKCYELFLWINNCKNFSLEERKIFDRYKYIIIYGHGHYGEIVSNVLNKNYIDISGYIVSMFEEGESMYDKIWKPSDYPYSKSETLVVIGINQNNGGDIIEILKNNEFDNIYTPVWID